MADALPWWKTAVVYQIYPRSFADTNRDGVGDLEGIRRHLDYLEWLGVDCVWLSPIYRSPMADFGYDVSDHCDVDPVFGSLDDFDRLLAEAHARGIRVLLDWVPNHTSDQHRWFVESRSSRHNPKRHWYYWREGRSDGSPPNNWRRSFAGEVEWVTDPMTHARSPAVVEHPPSLETSAWTFDQPTGQWYLHLFLPEQPDVNWSHPDLRAAMLDVLRFWLDRGVDGFRADVIHGIGKDPALPDDPPELRAIPRSATNDDPLTHVHLRQIRRLLDSYGGDRVMVGEVYLLSTPVVATYYGRSDELHLAFNFPPLYAAWDADEWRAHLEEALEEFGPIGAWPTWVLSNHDNVRHRSRYGGSEAVARAAAVLLLTLPGTPFLYAGEELGLEDALVPACRTVDPGGRDGCRAPIPWDGSPGHGWGMKDPWLPWPPEADHRNVSAQQADEGSTLHLYRRLLTARHSSPALSAGSCRLLPAPSQVLAYERRAGDDRQAVLVNFGAGPAVAELPGDWVVEVTSDGVDEGRSYRGRLGAGTAAVLRPT